MDLKDIAGVARGQLVRVATDAVLGKRQVATSAVSYAPGSNTASFVCTGTTLDYRCDLTSVTPMSGRPEVARVCIANDAGFVLEWTAEDLRIHRRHRAAGGTQSIRRGASTSPPSLASGTGTK